MGRLSSRSTGAPLAQESWRLSSKTGTQWRSGMSKNMLLTLLEMVPSSLSPARVRFPSDTLKSHTLSLTLHLQISFLHFLTFFFLLAPFTSLKSLSSHLFAYLLFMHTFTLCMHILHIYFFTIFSTFITFLSISLFISILFRVISMPLTCFVVFGMES